MPFASAKALREKMKQLDKILQPDGWWFDFYSTAQKDRSDWIVAAADYAHTHNQTIGGNVFGDEVPPHSDAIAFVDDPVKNSKFGFDFNENQIAKLKANTTDAVILGHLQSNAQNGETTESCVYIQQWNDTKRMEYLRHWDENQCSLGFRFMWPLFYPLCPGAFAFDPLGEEGNSGRSLYEEIKGMMMKEKNCQQERL